MLEPFHTLGRVEAGCDEAGRGCIAGPLYAAAVILPPQFDIPLLNDSKKLSASVRFKLKKVIQSDAVAFGIGVVEEEEIDQINILNASFLAMHRAIKQLEVLPDHLLIDGNRFKPFHGISHTCIVKGDARFASIAAASVLAKTSRDEYMAKLHNDYPEYGWNQNMGYPTRLHREAVLEFGATPHHRRSFRLLNDQIRIDFS
jgi:ribonuclease HII